VARRRSSVQYGPAFSFLAPSATGALMPPVLAAFMRWVLALVERRISDRRVLKLLRQSGCAEPFSIGGGACPRPEDHLASRVENPHAPFERGCYPRPPGHAGQRQV